MVNLVVDPELWKTRLLPEGTLEQWVVPDMANVQKNQPLVELRIENRTVKLKAPAAGRLIIIAHSNSIVEPGAVIGEIETT